MLEIQLRERAFYVKKRTGGEKYDIQKFGSPVVSWAMYATWELAWAKAFEKLGGWGQLDQPSSVETVTTVESVMMATD